MPKNKSRNIDIFYENITRLSTAKKYIPLINYYNNAATDLKFVNKLQKDQKKTIDIMLKAAKAFGAVGQVERLLTLYDDIITALGNDNTIPEVKKAKELKAEYVDNEEQIFPPKTPLEAKTRFNAAEAELKLAVAELKNKKALHINILLENAKVYLETIIFDSPKVLIKFIIVDQEGLTASLKSLHVLIKKLIENNQEGRLLTSSFIGFFGTLKEIYLILPEDYPNKYEHLFFILEKLVYFHKIMGSKTQVVTAENQIKELQIHKIIKKIAEFKQFLSISEINERHLKEVEIYLKFLTTEKNSLIEKNPKLLLDLYLIAAPLADKLNKFNLADSYYIATYHQALKIKNQADIDKIQVDILKKRLMLHEKQQNTIEALEIYNLLLDTSDIKDRSDQEKLIAAHIQSIESENISSKINGFEKLIQVLSQNNQNKNETVKNYQLLAKTCIEAKKFDVALQKYTEGIRFAEPLKINVLELYLQKILTLLKIEPLDINQLKKDIHWISIHAKLANDHISLLSVITHELFQLANAYYESKHRDAFLLIKMTFNLQKLSALNQENTRNLYSIMAQCYFERKSYTLALKYAELAKDSSHAHDNLLQQIQEKIAFNLKASISETPKNTKIPKLSKIKKIKKPMKPIKNKKTSIEENKPVSIVKSLKKTIKTQLITLNSIKKSLMEIKNDPMQFTETPLDKFKTLQEEYEILQKDTTQHTSLLTKKMRDQLMDIKKGIKICEEFIEDIDFLMAQKKLSEEKNAIYEKLQKEVLIYKEQMTELVKDINLIKAEQKETLKGAPIFNQQKIKDNLLKTEMLLSDIEYSIAQIPNYAHEQIRDELNEMVITLQPEVRLIKEINEKNTKTEVKPIIKSKNSLETSTPSKSQDEDFFRDFFSNTLFPPTKEEKTTYEILKSIKFDTELNWLEALTDEFEKIATPLGMRSSVVAQAMQAYYKKQKIELVKPFKDIDFISEFENAQHFYAIKKILRQFGFKIKKNAVTAYFVGFKCIRKTAKGIRIYEFSCDAKDYESINYSYMKSPIMWLTTNYLPSENKDEPHIQITNKLSTMTKDPYKNMLKICILTGFFNTELPDLEKMTAEKRKRLKFFCYRSLKDYYWCVEALKFQKTVHGNAKEVLLNYAWIRDFFYVSHSFESCRNIFYKEVAELIRSKGFLEKGQLHIKAFLSVILEQYYYSVEIADTIAEGLMPFFNKIFANHYNDERDDVTERLFFSVKYLIEHSKILLNHPYASVKINDIRNPFTILSEMNKETLRGVSANIRFFILNIEWSYRYHLDNILSECEPAQIKLSDSQMSFWQKITNKDSHVSILNSKDKQIAPK